MELQGNPGEVYHVELVPPIPEATTYFDAGPLSIGVEFRLLTDDLVNAFYKDDGESRQIVDAIRPAVFDDRGLSFHVFDRDAGIEYLRFDMFEEGPHYHYINSASSHRAVMYDPYSCGDMFSWAVDCLRSRLPDMLRYAGADELADRVDTDALDVTLPEVVRFAEETLRGAASSV
jgi:hypothetical protein